VFTQRQELVGTQLEVVEVEILGEAQVAVEQAQRGAPHEDQFPSGRTLEEDAQDPHLQVFLQDALPEAPQLLGIQFKQT